MGLLGQIRLASACVAGVVATAVAGIASEGIEYPRTRVKPVTDTLHGVEITDNYRWLERGDSWVVRLWVKRQNRLTRTLLDRFPEREQICRRLEELYKAPRVSVPFLPSGGRYLQLRREGMQEHAVLYAVGEGDPATMEVVFDPNEWEDSEEVRFELCGATRDGTLVAYMKRRCNRFFGTLYVLDTETGETLPDETEGVAPWPFAWHADGRGFFYLHWCVVCDDEDEEPEWGWAVRHHVLGTDGDEDPIIFGEDNPEGSKLDFQMGEDGRYLFLSERVGRWKNDVYVMDLMAEQPEVTPIAVGLDSQFFFRSAGGTFYFSTDWKAPLTCIYRCDASDPRPEKWEQIIPEHKGPIVRWILADRRVAVIVLEDMEPRLLTYSLKGEFEREVGFPAVGTMDSWYGEWDRPELYLRFTSFLQPRTPYVYDMARHRLTPIERPRVPFDFNRYTTRKVRYTSKDGTPVPMLLVHKTGMKRDGKRPVLLGGYGGFNVVNSPVYDPGLLVWLEAGGVYAVACLRGGGELGREWHAAGKGFRKQNTFDDFIAAAEYLIAEGYTRPSRLAIRGASNGGLLVGAVLTQRPDLFRAVLCEGPLLDMVRYHEMRGSKTGLEEYGTAEDPGEFRDLYAYSPYHHVREGVTYPAVFLKTGTDDFIVQPAHAYKMTAALQAVASVGRPVVLWVEPKGGHWPSDLPRTRQLQSEADSYTWLMWQLGMIEEPQGEGTAGRRE